MLSNIHEERISGIPDSIPQVNLENKVITLIKSTVSDNGVRILKKDIQACHRLKKIRSAKSEVTCYLLIYILNYTPVFIYCSFEP